MEVWTALCQNLTYAMCKQNWREHDWGNTESSYEQNKREKLQKQVCIVVNLCLFDIAITSDIHYIREDMNSLRYEQQFAILACKSANFPANKHHFNQFECLCFGYETTESNTATSKVNPGNGASWL